MLIETNDLKNIKVSKHSVVGRARKNTSLLNENELVFMVEGVRNFINLVLKDFRDSKHGYSSESSGGGSFNAFRGFDETTDVFLNKASTLVDYDPVELQPKDYQEQGIELEYDVTGDFIDMGRHMEGIPESFGSLHNGNPRARRVRFYVDVTHVAYTNHEDITNQSQRIVRLIDALEQANVRCELVIVQSGGCAHSECIVKRFNDPLILEDVAVATHPEWLRRMCFKLIENSDTFDYGYGDPTWLKNKGASFKSKFNDELTIFIHSGPSSGRGASFDKLESIVVDEISQAIPSLALIEVTNQAVTTTS